MVYKCREMLIDLLVDNNLIMFQVLGICFVFVVIFLLQVVFVMFIVVIFVMVFLFMFILMICNQILGFIWIIVQMVVIVFFVILVDQMFKVFVFEILKILLVFVGFIIINCIVMGCVEVFVMKNLLIDSFIDGVGNGLGYGLILMLVGVICEFFGFGSFFGVIILEIVNNGGWYVLNGLLFLLLLVFFIIGLIIWVFCVWKFEQVEECEYKI